MRAVDFKQGNGPDSEDWHAWRAGGISASQVATIVGKDPWSTAYKLYLERTGQAPSRTQTPAMKKGIMFEGMARDAFEKEHGIECFPTCFEGDNPIHRASLDGITFEGDVVEIKVPGFRAVAMARVGVIPEHYNIQMQWQMHCCGAKKAYYYVYDADNDVGYTMLVDRDQPLIDELVVAADEFWYLLENKIPPETDESDHIIVTDPDIVALAEEEAWHKRRIAQIKADLKKAERDEKASKDALLEALDDGNAIVGPLKVTRVSKDSYDFKRMVEELGIDLEQYKKPSIGYPLISLIKDKGKEAASQNS